MKSPLLSTALLIGMLSMIGATFSIAHAQTSADPINNATGLVVAMGSLMGAIAAIATSIVGMIKSVSGNSLISHEMQNKIREFTDNMKASDEWIKEHTNDIKSLVEAITKISPETKNFLDEKGLSIQLITKDIENTDTELRDIYEKLPKTSLK